MNTLSQQKTNAQSVSNNDTIDSVFNVKARYSCLHKKIVLITGGASGIGESIAFHFYRQGATVIIIDQNQEAGKFIESIVNRSGHSKDGNIKFYPCDLTDCDDLKTTINTIGKTYGQIDILVNNVGCDKPMESRRINEVNWNSSMSINVDTAFFCSQAVIPFMKPQRQGAIINFGAMPQGYCKLNMAAYTTAKGAVKGMTSALAKELGSNNIRVNMISPSWVATDRQLAKWRNQESIWTEQQALKRKIIPSDVAEIALFLSSHASNMVTGQEFIIDGGASL